MMFDATTTWNKQAWDVHEAVNHLVAEGRLPDTIIVGVWNSGDTRVSEYFPAKALDFVAQPTRNQLLEQGLKGQVLADRYLRFLVEELKPAIDRRYSTLPDAAHTFIMGSSYGGLISLYAISEYPEVFSGAACLSTHWIGGFTANATVPLALFRYFESHLPDPASHRIYIDRGTEGLDALYATPLVFFDQMMKDRGYQEQNYASRVFAGASHIESDWKQRLDQPLRFLFDGFGAP
jgi:enterochelin esterase-like enzyme